MKKFDLRKWNFWHYRWNGKFESFNTQAKFKFFPLPKDVRFPRDNYNTPLVGPDFFKC